LKEINIDVLSEERKGFGDIREGVYEGGFKIWECEFDGL
jgi:hypothetical protein